MYFYMKYPTTSYFDVAQSSALTNNNNNIIFINNNINNNYTNTNINIAQTSTLSRLLILNIVLLYVYIIYYK